MGFFLKKVIGSLLIPPGFFLLLLVNALLFKRKRNFILILTILLLYLLSINPIANFLLFGLEKNLRYPPKEVGGAIVVLGGGARMYETGFGFGLPAEDFTFRLYAAYELYRVKKRPIFISGGKVSPKELADADVGKAFLLSLGVSAKDIFVENLSRDTQENAKNLASLILKQNVREILLVTSAYHIKRASREFSQLPLKIHYWPSHFLSTDPDSYSFKDFLPLIAHLRKSSLALHEYFGLLWSYIRP